MPVATKCVLSVWVALLLLNMVSFLADAGRHLPAGPATQSAAPNFKLIRVNWDDETEWIRVQVAVEPRMTKSSMTEANHRRRHLVGSSPPNCLGKCGSCSPCFPIHTSINNATQAGASSSAGALTEQEYYPEVWRCKCGSNLYTP